MLRVTTNCSRPSIGNFQRVINHLPENVPENIIRECFLKNTLWRRFPRTFQRRFLRTFLSMFRRTFHRTLSRKHSQKLSCGGEKLSTGDNFSHMVFHSSSVLPLAHLRLVLGLLSQPLVFRCVRHSREPGGGVVPAKEGGGREGD